MVLEVLWLITNDAKLGGHSIGAIGELTAFGWVLVVQIGMDATAMVACRSFRVINGLHVGSQMDGFRGVVAHNQ